MKKQSELVVLVESSGLEKNERKSLIEQFNDYENIAQEWKVKAEAIVVINRDQVTEMAMAKEVRKKFSNLRIDVEKSRKALKEQSLRKGQAIDSIARYLTSLIKPIEDHLKLQEKFIELDDARIVREKLEADEKKAEEEMVAKEKAEEAERKRIRLENAKLKKDAEARELKMKKEREEAERKEAVSGAKVEKAERELREKKEAEEKAKVEAEATKQREAEDKAKAEKNATYKKWLADNKFDQSTMKVDRDGSVFTMWKQVSKISIS